MKWLKKKIKEWLLKDEIQKVNEVWSCYDRVSMLCEQSLKTNREMQKMYNEITDVAVDVGFHDSEHSWAVVCIAGRPEYVKFIPLSRADARTVMNFLRQFQYSQLIVDSPLRFKDELHRYFI